MIILSFVWLNSVLLFSVFSRKLLVVIPFLGLEIELSDTSSYFYYHFEFTNDLAPELSHDHLIKLINYIIIEITSNPITSSVMMTICVIANGFFVFESSGFMICAICRSK